MDVNFNEVIGSQLFWAAVAALVPLSVAIGSLITIGINAWSKSRNRPEADWSITMVGYATLGHPNGEKAGFHIRGRMTNVGDGPAFQVSLVGDGCKAGLRSDTTDGMPDKAFMAPGDLVGFWVDIDLANWDGAAFDIVWTMPPTRLGKRMKTRVLPKERMDEPGIQVTDPKSGAVKKVSVAQAIADQSHSG